MCNGLFIYWFCEFVIYNLVFDWFWDMGVWIGSCCLCCYIVFDSFECTVGKECRVEKL